mgnify:CR=1 FL=1
MPNTPHSSLNLPSNMVFVMPLAEAKYRSIAVVHIRSASSTDRSITIRRPTANLQSIAAGHGR